MATYGGRSIVLQNLTIQIHVGGFCRLLVTIAAFLIGMSAFARSNDFRFPFQDTTIIEETTSSIEKNRYFLSKDDEGASMDSLVIRHVPADIIGAYKSDEDYIYPPRKEETNDPPKSESRKIAPGKKKVEADPYKPASEKSWVQKFLWLLIIGGFVAFLVIWLSSSNINLFRRSAKPFSTSPDEEEEHDDIFSINYQRDIDKAARNGNYRLAIRLLFLRLLKNLSERNIIHYKQDNTNFDYLMQLSSTNYYEDFFKVTRDYEYSWYGQFEVNEETYKVIRSDFDKMESKLH